MDHVYDLIRAGVIPARDISRPGARRRTYRIPASALETLPLFSPPGTRGLREPPPSWRYGGMAEFNRIVAEIKAEARKARRERFSGRGDIKIPHGGKKARPEQIPTPARTITGGEEL